MPLSRELPSFVIDRPRLIERIDAGTKGRLTLVLGPSGSGKSVLVRQWAGVLRSSAVAWVAVDVTTADAVGFGRQLVAAVARHSPGFGDEALRHLELGGDRMGQAFLAALLGEMASLPRTVVVVDDLHDLPVPVVEELDWLVRRAPAPVRVVAASRSLPAMSLARLRAHGELAEVLAPELSFTAEEARAVVERVAGIRLTRSQLEVLGERTEGWAVGVHLAAVALRGSLDLDADLAAFSGADREVADYLADEVVAHQPPAIQRFLLETCVLEAMDAELCDALTGRSDSQQVLAELERRNLFVVGLDARRGWYRYHQLFADQLRYQLRVGDPARHDELLVRAARWHLDHDDLAMGIEHLLRARRWAEVLDLIGADGWRFYERGEAATAIRWLEAVPAAERARHDQAPLTLATLHQVAGNSTAAVALLDELERSAEPGSFRLTCIQALRASRVQWEAPPEEALAQAEAALAWLADPPVGERRRGEPPHGWVEGAARVSAARCLLHLGRLAEARACLEAALGLPAGYLPWRIRSLGLLAQLEVAEGHLEQAYGTARQALRLAAEVGAAIDETSACDAHLALGRLAYERDELDQADRSLAAGEAQARVDRRSALVAAFVVERARVVLARGRARDALELLVRWRREGEAPPPADVAAQAAAVEAQALLALGELPRAKRVLSRAPRNDDTLAVAAHLAAHEGDGATLALVLDSWPASPRTRSRIRYLLWRALAERRAGDEEAAAARVRAAVGLAAVDGHRRAFLDGGPELVELVRAEVAAGGARMPGLGDALAGATVQPAPGRRRSGIVSEREEAVLRLLATPLSNQEIAERLAISPNTLKTHLKRIYRKLGVTSRRGALERAAELGLGA